MVKGEGVFSLISLYKIVYSCIDEVLDFLNNFYSKFYFISTNLDYFGVFFALASLEQKNTPKKVSICLDKVKLTRKFV